MLDLARSILRHRRNCSPEAVETRLDQRATTHRLGEITFGRRKLFCDHPLVIGQADFTMRDEERLQGSLARDQGAVDVQARPFEKLSGDAEVLQSEGAGVRQERL